MGINKNIKAILMRCFLPNQFLKLYRQSAYFFDQILITLKRPRA